jgi:CRISPR system Cascade subunit CasB
VTKRAAAVPGSGQETSGLERAIERIAQSPEALAALRRALGRPPGESPEAWPYTVPLSEGRGRAYERAVHYGLCLFAWHQQSHSNLMHHREGPSLGEALRQLRARRADSAGVERRFLAAATADTVEELVHHLRGLITLLRGEGIRLDYVQLVRDLELWGRPGGPAAVRRRWGRDFYVAGLDSEEIDSTESLPDAMKEGE